MSKKIILFSLLVSFFCLTINNSSDALFFKRHKTVKKQTQQVQTERKEEKKVILAEIFASWCPGCKNIQPTIDQLIKEVPEIDFVQFDVSTPSRAQASGKLAKELNLLNFYLVNKSKTATVGVVIRSSGEIISLLQNNPSVDDYKNAIQQALLKIKESTTPP